MTVDYQTIPAHEYHLRQEVGSSAVRALLRSAAHYESEFLAGRIREETKALRLGTYGHTATLERDRWLREYVRAPQVDRRTKEGRAAWADFVESNPGRIHVDAEEYDLAEAMAASVRKHPAAARLLADAQWIEPSIFWADDLTGVECRDRPDLITKSGIVVELKTCEDASMAGFGRAVANHLYHVQMAHHDAGYRARGKGEPAALVWIAVEKTPPHVVAVRAIDPVALSAGHTQRTRGLDLLAECRAAQKYPGYSDIIEVQIMPAWAS